MKAGKTINGEFMPNGKFKKAIKDFKIKIYKQIKITNSKKDNLKKWSLNINKLNDMTRSFLDKWQIT